MKKSSYLSYVLVLAIGLGLGYVFFGGTNPSASTQIEKGHDHEGESALQMYTCSMHPSVRQDAPGNCPICGMNLIPVSNASNSDKVFTMTNAAMQLAQIQTTLVKVSETEKELQLPAKVVADETQRSVVTAQFSGRIIRLKVRFNGQKVAKGDVIAFVYSPELREIHRELLVAKKSADANLVEVSKERLRQVLIRESTISELLKSETVWDEYPITSYSNGIVTELMVSDQSSFMKGDALMRLDDLSKVWVEAYVQESDISLIELNQQVQMQLQNGKKMNLNVDFINPTLNEATRTYVIRMNVANKMDLKPGALATVLVNINLPKSVYIPKTAVLWTGSNSLVYVQKMDAKEPTFELREVVLGVSLSNEVEILSGLNSGDQVVTNGVFRLDSAVQLAGLPSMMTYSKAAKTIETNTTKVDKKSLSKESINQLNDVLKAYLILKNALVSSDLEATKKSVIQLDNYIESVNHSRFEPDAHDVWMTRADAMNLELSAMKKSNDLGQIRLHFITLSTALIELIKQVPFTENVHFVQFCPMADSDRGAYWISEQIEIKNPYFGSMMLTCGEIIEEINSNKSF